MTYCDNRALREEMYRAYSTRASDQGPNAGKWDNSPVMEILALRHELAQLLGFDSYAYKSLATKMAKDPQQVLDFLTDRQNAPVRRAKSWPSCAPSPKPSLASMSCSRGTLPTAKNRSSTSTASAMSSCAYFRKTKPLAACLKWLSAFTVLPLKSVPMSMWHPEVRFFELYDEHNELRGSFYLDLYAREHKRGGAWMDDCVGQMRKLDGSLRSRSPT